MDSAIQIGSNIIWIAKVIIFAFNTNSFNMTTKQKSSKTKNIILWITQSLMALTFIWAGTMKIFKPTELPWQWIKENPNLVTITGIIDLLTGIGFVLPGLLRMQQNLTIYVSYLTIVLMAAAIIFHVSRGEASQIGFNIFVIGLALIIALGRQKK